MSNSVLPQRQQPTRLCHPWYSPGKNTRVDCHFLLQCMKVKLKVLSHVWLFVTPWTTAYQAPPSMGFSRQEYWSGLPLPSLSKIWQTIEICCSQSTADLVSESLLPGSLCLHIVEKSGKLCGSFLRALIPFIRAPSSRLKHFPQFLTLNTIIFGGMVSTF